MLAAHPPLLQGIYAPSRTCSDQQVQVGYYLNTTANQIAAALNATGLATGNATWVEQAQVSGPVTEGREGRCRWACVNMFEIGAGLLAGCN